MHIRYNHLTNHIVNSFVVLFVFSLSIFIFYSYESGVLEDPGHEGPEDLYQMTKDPRKSPDEPDKLEITFRKGIVAVFLLANNLIQ